MLKKKIIILSGNKFRGVLKLTLLENSYLNIDLTAHFLPMGNYVFFLKIDNQVERFSFDGEKLIKRLHYSPDIDAHIECAVADNQPPYILMSATGERDLSFEFYNEIKIYMEKGSWQFNTSDAAKLDTVKLGAQNILEKGAAKAHTQTNLDTLIHNKSTHDEEHIPAEETDSPTPSEQITEKLKENETSFFGEIKDSIEEFFQKYPPYEPLVAIVPSSKWVRVDTEDTFYVVGLLYNTSGVTHICYGIPGEYAVKPLSETLMEWLPLNPEEWEKQGFWMIYQNAETGKI